jgi:uncharacterized protein (DUF433 family)
VNDTTEKPAIQEPTNYVFQTEPGGWRLTGTRVSLDSIVHAYWEGLSPEAIALDFPTLSLEQIHGSIAFYLRNRQEIDRYLESQKALWEQGRQESERENAVLLSRLRALDRNPAGKEDQP